MKAPKTNKDMKDFIEDLVNEPDIIQQDNTPIIDDLPEDDQDTTQVVSSEQSETKKFGLKLAKPEQSQNTQLVKPIEPTAKTANKVGNPAQLDELAKKYHDVFDQLLGYIKDDRDKLEHFINVYAVQVTGETPKQAFVEGLVALLGIKSKMSVDGTRLLETAAKMFSATKTMVEQQSKAPLDGLDGLLAQTFDKNEP